MRRKRSGLENSAFSPPFYTPNIGSNAYNIPEEYESELIDIYTNFTEEIPDIKLEELPKLLKNELHIPEELIPNQEEFRSWLIDGTEIVDFEKWLYNGYFWLLLNNHIGEVDMIWSDIWSSLDTSSHTERIESLRTRKLYLADIRNLIKIGKLDASAVGMLQTAGNGKVFVTYIDFYVLLGRLGMFKI